MPEKTHKKRTRTAPYSVRFDRKKYDFIKSREGLETPKEIVDFLMDQYYFTNTMNASIPQSTVGHASGLATFIPEKQQEPIVQKTIEVELSQYEAYLGDLRASKSMYDITTVMGELSKDWSVNPVERKELERQAKILSQNFYND